MMTLFTCASFLLVAIATCVHTQDFVDGSDVKLDASCISGNPSVDWYALVSHFYGGLFHTEDQIREQEGQWREEHKSKRDLQMWRDYLSWWCCQTVKYHDNKPTLNNWKGQMRTIMHLPLAVPPKYQWYPKAKCGYGGRCFGKCRLEYITVCLLVYPLSGPLFPPEFDWFHVPGYCSCKSN